MKKQAILTRGLLEGHFLLTSGRHSPYYWEKMRLLQHPDLTRQLCRALARHFEGQGVEAVAGPQLGGLLLAYEVASQLRLRAVYAEKGEEGLTLRQTLSPGERVLVVDDVLTSGGSLQKMVEAVRRAGGRVVGVGVLVDRSPPSWEGLDVPLFACHRLSLPSYLPQECPQCQAGVPLQRLGGGR